jgi:hypothetical protein
MLSIVKFKGCKRCGGDLFLEKDSEGADVFCLQCSASYVRQRAPLLKKTNTRRVYVRQS